MRTYHETLDNLYENSKILKSKGLTREDVDTLFKEYQSEFTNTLLKYGYINIFDHIKLEIVRVQKRIHVLRGNTYQNWRKYKLKTTVAYNYYQKIEEIFDELVEG